MRRVVLAVVLSLVLPNYATTVSGAAYSASQLAFIAAATLALFGGFTPAMRMQADQILVVSRFRFARDATLQTNVSTPP